MSCEPAETARGPMFNYIRYLLAVPLGAWTLAIAWLTLEPGSWSPPPTLEAFLCVGCGWRGSADIILNWGLFVPVGALAGLLLGGRRALVIAVAFTAGIEVAQVWIPGRYPSLQDIIFNSLGALAGAYAMARGVPYAAQRVIVILAFVTWLAPVALLRPMTTDEPLYGQWTPVFGKSSRYDGTLLQVAVGGITVPPWRAPDRTALADAVRTRRPIEVTLTVEPRPESLAPVFQIMDGRQIEIVSIQTRADDLHVRGHNLARVLRLDQPDVHWKGAFAGLSPGDTVTLTVDRARASTCISMGDRSACGLAPSPGQGWGLLLYLERAEDWLRLAVDLAWIALLGLTIGAMSARRSVALGIALTAAVLGTVLSLTTPDVAFRLWEPFALLVAAVAGAFARPRIIRLWSAVHASL